MNNTIDYYNEHYDQFVSDTIDANMTFAYQQFLTKLHEGREAIANKDLHILDLGCGSGRDTKYFLSLGYVYIILRLKVKVNKKIKGFSESVILIPKIPKSLKVTIHPACPFGNPRSR